MKKIIAVAGALALAACGGSEVDEPAEADMGDDPVVTTAEAPTMGSAGTYSMQDGVVMTDLTLGADGTYTMSDGTSVTESGTWTDGPNGPCLTAEGAEEACFTRTSNADGGVTMTDANGQSTTWQYQP